ncbi:MAG TPA: DDE-type integrase/transposase/recombinase [Bryobacteraceae bacterium]|jgi:IS1 family transposase|nr:DDE-type integrase/transposase/recombinase [Bryobacteraceae bacterium]
MNRLNTATRIQVLRCLIEGCSIRSTVRMTGAAKNTVVKLLVELGEVCTQFMDETMRNLPCQRLQADEIWAFVGCNQKQVTVEKIERDGICGDVWTWVAIDADTKLVPCFMLGQRDPETARDFMEDLASRLANRVQLTTDGLKAYLTAVKSAFGNDIDYSMLVKIYGTIDTEGQRRYSPADCIGCERKRISGDPDPDHISTSYVERQNLNMRMGMRRLTRLTNAFSKKIDNLIAAVAVYYTYYNFCRVHQTLKTTPAVKAGVANHVWSVDEVIGLLEAVEPKATRPAKIPVSN